MHTERVQKLQQSQCRQHTQKGSYSDFHAIHAPIGRKGTDKARLHTNDGSGNMTPVIHLVHRRNANHHEHTTSDNPLEGEIAIENEDSAEAKSHEGCNTLVLGALQLLLDLLCHTSQDRRRRLGARWPRRHGQCMRYIAFMRLWVVVEVDRLQRPCRHQQRCKKQKTDVTLASLPGCRHRSKRCASKQRRTRGRDQVGTRPAQP
mmetsp:Transcript_71084/g.169669  ORF Transcript_71084/g.169669 Transcript_71084/m.169669 type:complete len:204 (+) Transcript_71084:586-1197(+)